MQIEKKLMCSSIKTMLDGPMHYRLNHDSYMIEIDANNYSINKTIEYLKKYPDIYVKHKDDLKRRKNKYLNDLETYDAYNMFENINLVIKETSNQLFEIFNAIPSLYYFYDEKGKFNSISDILAFKDEIDEEESSGNRTGSQPAGNCFYGNFGMVHR